MAKSNHDFLNSDEANAAGWVAIRGASIGAVKWGIVTAALGGIGFYFSPTYRALTPQFKLYLQMTGMTFGGMVEADWRLRQHEAQVRLNRRIAMDRARWKQYEQEFEEAEVKRQAK